MKNLKKSTLIITILSFLALFTSAKAEIKVVASIKPIHSLASYLMDGVAKPDLIVDGYSSPHGFPLKPSHAKMLQEADLIFWVGEDLENFMEKPLDSIAKKAEKIELMEIKGLNKLKFRERNIFGDHDDHDDHGHKEDGHKEDDHDDHDHKKKDGHDDHDDHDHKKKDGHKEDDHDDHDHKKKDGHDDHDDHGHKKKDDHDDHDDHAGHEGHHHGEHDPHIWLDPMNAKVILNEMAEHLIENDAKNASKYKSNLKKALKDIDKLVSDVSSELNQSVASIVFHDAYQYFEKRFGVIPAGALTLNPDVLPGAKQIADIQDVINDKGIKCIFSEPQYNPKIIETLGNDMNISTGVMDPLGAYIDAGPSMYSDLINQIANSIKDCH